MKTTGVMVILSFFLVFVLSANRLLAAPEVEAVRDTEGKEVIAGLNYYISRIILGPRRTGITTVPGILIPCPEDVVLEHENRGKPVQFHHVDGKHGVVHLQTDLNIMLRGSAYCRTHTVIWTLDQIFGQFFVQTPEAEPPFTWKNRFRIEKVGSDNIYKFVFCHPSTCDNCSVQCEDLGICSDVVERLCLSGDNTLKVVFEKYNSTRTLATSSY